MNRASISTVIVTCDIHYASELERARRNPEGCVVPRWWLRAVANAFRSLWLGDAERNNITFTQFIDVIRSADWLIANGDFSCDSAFVGVSDDAAMRSAKESLAKLRAISGTSFEATIGDHELGRASLFGGPGGPRLSSWFRCLNDLELRPFWQLAIGPYVLIGVTSSLLALEAFEPQLLSEERETWYCLRAEHLDHIRRAFRELPTNRRVLLFCHDPAALAWLGREESVRSRMGQIDQTLVGHLHSRLVISGIRTLAHLRNSLWRDFKVRVCPALACRPWPFAGLYYRISLDLEGQRPLQFRLQKFRSGDRVR